MKHEPPCAIGQVESSMQKAELDRLIGEVANEFFERTSRGERIDVEDYAERYPQIADIIRETFPSLCLLDGAQEAGQALDSPSSMKHRRLGDFQIVGELGRGGMGIVYEAEQISMGRRVALKVMPFAALAGDKPLQRFRNEVRAAATLDHPNVVSVYSVGEEQGIQYYAMQLIRGRSLSDVIAALVETRSQGRRLNGESIHSACTAVEADRGPDAPLASDVGKTADPTTRAQGDVSTLASDTGRAFYESVAELGIQAAQALQYAHQQGVVHRDIKPANLLIDANSQLYIADFGLARIEKDAGVTLTGDLVGTLRYMAPEQALGNRVIVDNRADVYSLAATLYELLTLRPAYQGEGRQQLLKQIAFEEPVRPRLIDRKVPQELDTIVMKALSKDADERYESAQEMADDLKRFVANEPIQATPPTVLQRLTKWAGRHRAAVWSACAAAMISVIVLSASVLLLRRAYSNERSHRTRAEENAAIAQDAVDEMYQEFAMRWLSDDAELTMIQRDMLRKAVKIYQRLAEHPPTGTDWQRGQAKLFNRMGRIHARLSQYAKAKTAYERSIRLYQQSLHTAPGESDQLKNLAGAYSDLGLVHAFLGEFTQGEQMLRKSRETLEKLGDEHRDDLEYRHRLAANDLNQAGSMHSRGRIREAERLARRAREGYVALGEENPDNLTIQQHYAMCSGQLSDILVSQRRYEEAAYVCREGVRACRRVKIELKEDRDVRALEAKLVSQLGTILRGANKLEAAEAKLREAVELWRPICLSFIDEAMVPEHLAEAAVTMIELGVTLAAAGKNDDAEKQLILGAEFAPEVAKDFPDVPGFHSAAARAYHALGGLLKKHRPEDAPAAYDKAIEIRRRLVARYQSHPKYHGQLAASLNDLGLCLEDQGQLDEARVYYGTAIQSQRTARKLAPAVPRYREGLQKNHTNMVRLLIATGDHVRVAAAAEDLVRDIDPKECTSCIAPKALVECMLLARVDEGLSKSRRDDVVSQYRDRCRELIASVPDKSASAATLNELAWFLATAAEVDFRDGARAVNLTKRAISLEPDNGTYFNTLGAAFYRAGRYREAVDALEESMELRSGGDAYDFFFSAMAQWQLGEHDAARQWHARATDAKGSVPVKNSELRRVAEEAADLISEEKSTGG